MLTLKEQLLRTVKSHFANVASAPDVVAIDDLISHTVDTLVQLVTSRNVLHPVVPVAGPRAAAVKTKSTVDDMLARTAVTKVPRPKPKPEPKVPSTTDQQIRKALEDIQQPFSRLDIFKALKWKGADITQAAVSGWVNRAVKRGEAVPAVTVPQHYWLKGHEGLAEERRPMVLQVPAPRQHVPEGPKPVVIGKAAPPSGTALPPFGDMDIVSGSGGVL